MIAVIFLFDRRKKDLVLDIIVDHGLGQELVAFGIAGQSAEVVLQKCRHLVHVEIDPGYVVCVNVGKGVKDLFEFPAHLFRLRAHLSWLLYYASAAFSAAAVCFISRAFSRAAGVISPAPRSLASSRSLSCGERRLMWVTVLSSPASFSMR